jgi:Protein of unknown function (DUF2800)
MRHAKLSPSASHRWLVCPGSVEANVGKPWEQSIHALEGTSAHALLEVCLRLGSDPEDFFGDTLEPGHMPVDEGMVDGVGYALDYVRSYVANNPKTKVLVEHEVAFGPAIGATADQAFGTSDIILDNYPVEVVVIDYKHGIGITVAVKDNSQLLLYALGMREQRGRYQRYRKVVVQPRLAKRKPVQEAPALTDAKIVQWAKKVADVVPIALGKNAPRIAGKHCRYCAADGNCVAQYDMVLKAAKEDFA